MICTFSFFSLVPRLSVQDYTTGLPCVDTHTGHHVHCTLNTHFSGQISLSVVKQEPMRS